MRTLHVELAAALIVSAVSCGNHPPSAYPHPNATALAWDAAFGTNLLDQPASFVVSNGTQIATAGSFTRVGSQSTPGVAMWDSTTSQWQAFPALPASAGPGATSLAFAAGADLLLGGIFPAAVGYWHGGVWSSTASGLQGTVSAMLWSTTGFYLGGQQFISENHSDSGVGYYDVGGGVWGTLGASVTSLPTSHVWTLATDGTLLYAGGTQLNQGTLAVFNLSSRQWSSIPSLGSASGAQPASLSSLAFDSPYLYACGTFTVAHNSNGDLPVQGVARWNTQTSLWEDLGGGVNGACVGLAKRNGHLFATGLFNQAGGQPSANAARWDPVARAWGPLASGLQVLQSGQFAQGTHVAIVGDDLNASVVFVGIFDTAGGQPATGIARWVEGFTGAPWSAVHHHLMPGQPHPPHPPGCRSVLEVSGRIMGNPGTMYSLQAGGTSGDTQVFTVVPSPVIGGGGTPMQVGAPRECVPENGGPLWVQIQPAMELVPVLVLPHS